MKDKSQRINLSPTKKSSDYEVEYIGVLDGIRAIAILVIVWFHFWQQSWIIPQVGDISLDWIPRNGCILVDLMIFLSGFCLFLPYARNMIYGEKIQSISEFYIKRIVRIAPSYYVALFIVLFLFALPLGEFVDHIAMWKDIIPHLTFTQNWFVESLLGTKLNGVLWTVAIEVQFYLLFPFVARAFQKKPIITYLAMSAIGVLASGWISHNYDTLNQGLYVNNAFTFVGVYANGMLGAWVYIAMTKGRKKNSAEGIFFAMVSLGSIWLYKIMCEHRMNYGSDTKWQVDYRYLLSLLFLIFVVSTIMAGDSYKKIFANSIMRFFAGISYNLYICHQYISVKLKEFRIPYWEGDTPPNQLGDRVWMWKYLILCILVSAVIAIVMTYLVEKPMAKLILKWYQKKVKKEQ